jgi:chemotaxis family two-component system response regulator Rcp1
MMNYSNKSVEVLLVEDNEGDIGLIKEAFKDSKTVNKFSVVIDGQQALDFLNKRGEFESSGRPDLILLDLNLPKINGFDVLREVKSNPALQKIPVIIFSSSASDDDVVRSYNLKANSYISKPANLEEFLNVVKTIDEFWFQTVKLPVN